MSIRQLDAFEGAEIFGRINAFDAENRDAGKRVDQQTDGVVASEENVENVESNRLLPGRLAVQVDVPVVQHEIVPVLDIDDFDQALVSKRHQLSEGLNE